MDDYPRDSIDRNRRLLALALDCRLIYPRKKEKIEAILAERSEAEETAVDVMEVLLAEKVLTDEKAAYLLDLDAHRAVCARDALFGRLAVANRMVSRETVDKALDYQTSQFQQAGESLRLGSILREWDLIRESDCTAILMTQNRILQEDLLDAMARLGRSPGEREVINKRFGVIAIKKELATVDQVGEALRQQKKEESQGQPPRFIGTILQEQGRLSPEEIRAVLREQRLMEVRRLDLLKALYPVKAELKIFKQLNKVFSCTLSEDSLEAFASKKTEPDTPVPVYEFTIWLRRTGICFGILNDAVLQEFIETAEIHKPVLVARGQAPEPGRDQGTRFYFQIREDRETEKAPEDQEEAGSEDHEKTDLTPPCPVIPGDLLAQITPGREGTSGKNVMGNPIHPPKPGIQSLSAGKGVRCVGNDFFATEEGLPMLVDGTTLVVSPLQKKSASTLLTADIREETGERYARTDLTVKGNILTAARVKCRSLTLQGDLLGEVESAGNITVEGCLGPKKAKKKKPAKKTEASDQSSPVEITSLGSVKVSGSVSSASVVCAGSFTAMGGPAAGVRICAGTGLALKEVGPGPLEASILRAGLLPGDPLLSIDHTLDAKTTALAGLKKAKDISGLKAEFCTEIEKAGQHQLEQDIYRYLAEIIEGPELFQYPQLQDKLDYLCSLPDFSSVRNYYLKIPDTPEALKVVARFVPPANKKSLDGTLKQIRSKIDPEPEVPPDSREEGPPMTETRRLEIEFRARLDALEREIEENQGEIEQIQREIATLVSAREKLGKTYLNSIAPGDLPVIRIKNRCEKGTVIQGILARYIVPETVYNVRFREIVDPGTLKTAITLES